MILDAEIQTPEASPPRRSRRSRPSSQSSSGNIEYTSLRDILVDAGVERADGSGCEVHDFDTSSINIRNQLLKYAASAYLQSAIVVAPRDQSCLGRVWRRMLQRRRCRIFLRSCTWQGCVRDPIELCAAFVAWSARHLVGFLVNRVACIRT